MQPTKPTLVHPIRQGNEPGSRSADAFIIAGSTVLVWIVPGPIFGFGDSWQLVINTATTIVTFLMVFLIQNTQNRDTEAVQVKLDELLRVTRPPVVLGYDAVGEVDQPGQGACGFQPGDRVADLTVVGSNAAYRTLRADLLTRGAQLTRSLDEGPADEAMDAWLFEPKYDRYAGS